VRIDQMFIYLLRDNSGDFFNLLRDNSGDFFNRKISMRD